MTGLSPASATIGTLVTITGTNFQPFSGVIPQVTLSQQGGGTIVAPPSTYTNTSICIVVPAGAATGPVTVTVDGQSATSSSTLTITTSSTFTLAASPSAGTVIQGQSTTFAVSITSTNGFNSLASLRGCDIII